jgi:2-keto-4-pentenoate hydratase
MRAAGEQLIGWKIGINVPAVREHFGLARPVAGHLTSASLIEPGATHAVAGAVRVGVEPEVAIRIGAQGAIESLAPAIEVVDLDPAVTELEAILAGNVFHRGVVLGAPAGAVGAADLASLEATVAKNGTVVERARFADTGEDLDAVVETIADRLALVGAQLEPGQVVIAGSLTPIVFVEPGDQIAVELSVLGTLEVSFN